MTAIRAFNGPGSVARIMKPISEPTCEVNATRPGEKWSQAHPAQNRPPAFPMLTKTAPTIASITSPPWLDKMPAAWPIAHMPTAAARSKPLQSKKNITTTNLKTICYIGSFSTNTKLMEKRVNGAMVVLEADGLIKKLMVSGLDLRFSVGKYDEQMFKDFPEHDKKFQIFVMPLDED